MSSFIVVLVIVFVVCFITNFVEIKVTNKNKNSFVNNNIYTKKKLMTDYEKYFYNILKELESELNVKIHPQINLASIIKKETNNYYINELFRNIDFAIFDENYDELMLLIEINDSTHKTYKRIIRDEKVDTIVKNTGIRIIKFYSNYPNKKDYIKERIKKELKNKKV